MNDKTFLVEKARIFATAAHAAVGQKRKYTGEEYIVHTVSVMNLVKTAKKVTDTMLAAALLHDTLEDTQVTSALLEQEFGSEVLYLVQCLTDVSRPSDGNRSTRKQIDRQHSASAPAEAQTIKVCDLIDNSQSIVLHDKKFAPVYLEEKRLLLEVLVRADADLRHQAFMQLNRMRDEITGSQAKV